jgi:catechol 2,3-dioxygenase-like lactoylglutathione lyase family enzyme
MNQKIAQIALVIDDYDKAINFFVQTLNFELIEDTQLNEVKRWVLVKPKGEGGCNLLLAKAATDTQKDFIGNQAGGRVFLFLNTDDFWRDYTNLLDKNVKIVRKPTLESYGNLTVFEDLWGNLWDLIGN